MRTDGRIGMTKQIVSFRKFYKRAKNANTDKNNKKIELDPNSHFMS